MTEILDPDCRDGKHGSCMGDPCECPCHWRTITIDQLETDNA